MIDLGRASRFLAGAIGEPGDRTFYLEVHSAAGATWFVVEKAQVAALAIRVRELVADEADDDDGDAAEISADPAPAFRVAEIRLLPTTEDRYRVELHPIESAGAPPVTFLVDGGLLTAMARHALRIVQAGRPRCPRCGLAMDPQGHVCPTGNGDLRHHRP